LFLIYNEETNDLNSDGKRKIGGFVSIEAVLSGKQFLMRPPKLLIGGSKLFYLDLVTNQPLTSKSGDTTRQLFLERVE
jgi:hypothetical protein